MKHHSKRLALTALTYIAALNAQHMSLNNHHSKHSINRTRQNTTEHDRTRERDNGWFIKAEAQVHQSWGAARKSRLCEVFSATGLHTACLWVQASP